MSEHVGEYTFIRIHGHENKSTNVYAIRNLRSQDVIVKILQKLRFDHLKNVYGFHG
jgi:hypothetical protein